MKKKTQNENTATSEVIILKLQWKLGSTGFYAKKTLYFIISFTFYPNYDWQLSQKDLKQLNWRMEKWQQEKQM